MSLSVGPVNFTTPSYGSQEGAPSQQLKPCSESMWSCWITPRDIDFKRLGFTARPLSLYNQTTNTPFVDLVCASITIGVLVACVKGIAQIFARPEQRRIAEEKRKQELIDSYNRARSITPDGS